MLNAALACVVFTLPFHTPGPQTGNSTCPDPPQQRGGTRYNKRLGSREREERWKRTPMKGLRQLSLRSLQTDVAECHPEFRNCQIRPESFRENSFKKEMEKLTFTIQSISG